ncbi:MAG: pilus assembly protein PilP [Bacteriovoracaceae bacterium]|nr:pilus assembly protein PilP [Bacteriovoracaceae bacterium]
MVKTNVLVIAFMLMNFMTTETSAQTAAPASGQKYEFLKSKTQVKNPLELRDPFKRKIVRKKNQASQAKKDSGYYSDELGIDNVPIERIRVVGVLLGEQRRAMVKIADRNDNEIFYLREGSKIGQNNAELRAILPAGIILVEKIRNVYDQDEYLETVIPITQE